MTIAATLSRIILGLLFAFAGVMGFLMRNPPPEPGLAGTFDQVFYQSHWAWFVAAVQLFIGLLLLSNRFIALALVMLAAFVYNSFAFHVTMAREALFAPFIVLALAALVALQQRAALLPLLRAR